MSIRILLSRRFPRFLTVLTAIGIAATAIAPVAARAQDAPAPHDHAMMQMKDGCMMARYGGPSYPGKPALTVTASLVEAGGGPENFSIATALTNMVGGDLVKAEVDKLTKQYGEDKVKTWIEVFNFAVKDSLKLATDAGVKLPKGNLKGKKLAETLVKAGLDKDSTFYVEFMLDKAVSNAIHHKVMDDIDGKYSLEADTTYHQVTNQAMYDLAQALGAKTVKLASFH